MPLSADPILPPPQPEAAQHSAQLAEHIATTIANEGDWIPFSRYMELALYAPGMGYYTAGSRKFGHEGDFITAPEISPMFARCFALQAVQVLDAVGGDILELGPGSGVFAADLYAELKSLGKAPGRYRLLEVSPDLRERQKRLIAERFPADLDRFEWIDALPEKIRGLVIGEMRRDPALRAALERRMTLLEERGERSA
jgi:SAM-dependent MidA family methyltransferase